METNKTLVPVPGNTYPAREKLKALGARWDVARKQWLIAQEMLDQAATAVQQSQLGATATQRSAGAATDSEQVYFSSYLFTRRSDVKISDSNTEVTS